LTGSEAIEIAEIDGYGVRRVDCGVADKTAIAGGEGAGVDGGGRRDRDVAEDCSNQEREIFHGHAAGNPNLPIAFPQMA